MSAGVSAAPSSVEIRPHRGWFDLDLGTVWRYRELLHILILRDLKVRYRQAALGAAWVVIQPLFAVLIFTVVFGHFAKIPSNGVPYPLFALAATMPWTYFAEASRRGARRSGHRLELVRKIYFKRLIILLAGVPAPLAGFAISFVVMIGMLVWYGMTPTWHLLLVLPLVVIAMLMSLAVALWLAPLNVRFRDIMHTLPFLLQIWMYASPIVYPLSVVPERWRALYSLNPMVGVIEGFRWALIGKSEPDVRAILGSVVVILVALAGGLVFFKRQERAFADLI